MNKAPTSRELAVAFDQITRSVIQITDRLKQQQDELRLALDEIAVIVRNLSPNPRDPDVTQVSNASAQRAAQVLHDFADRLNRKQDAVDHKLESALQLLEDGHRQSEAVAKASLQELRNAGSRLNEEQQALSVQMAGIIQKFDRDRDAAARERLEIDRARQRIKLEQAQLDAQRKASPWRRIAALWTN